MIGFVLRGGDEGWSLAMTAEVKLLDTVGSDDVFEGEEYLEYTDI